MTELYGQRVQTTVKQEYLPYVVDTILNSNVLFQRMVRSGENWNGRTLRVPFKYKVNNTIQSFRGADTFSVEMTDNRQFMEFTPSFVQISVVLPGDELSVADTDDKVLDLMKLTIQSDTEDLADGLGTMFYADGTGNSSKDPLGLAALVDDGSAVATIGGQSRSTYTTLQGVVTASAGILSLAKVDTLWAAVTSGGQKPTSFYTTETGFNLYGQLLRPQERITKEVGTMKGMSSGTGFDALQYNGKPVLMDEKCTAGAFIALNEKFLKWYALPFFNAKAVSYQSQIEGNDYEAPIGLGFSWSDWIVPDNSGTVVGHIYFGGQFVCTNPKRQGKLTSITSV